MKPRHVEQSPEDNCEALDTAVSEAGQTFGLPVTEVKNSLWGPETFLAVTLAAKRVLMNKGTNSPHPSPVTYFGGGSVSLMLLGVSSGFFALPSFLG